MTVLQCFSSQVFAARNSLVMQATLTAFAVSAGSQRCARLEEDARLEWRRAQTARLLLHGHVSVHVVLGGLPDALNGESVSVSSSTPWTAVSKSWGQSHQRGGNVGQPMQPQSKNKFPCKRTLRPWQQNPLVTNQRQLDGAGVQSGAMPLEVKECFCSLARVKPN